MERRRNPCDGRRPEFDRAALGALRPRLALLSGALVGLVVAGVTGSEALSGIRPTCEAQAHTLVHSLLWLVPLAPAVLSATAGAWIGRKLRPVGPAR